MATVAEILSSVGKTGERIYSVPWGYVNVANIDEDSNQIKLDCGNGNVCWLDGNGRLTSEGECLIWPSYDQRDWEAWGKEQAAKPTLDIGDYVNYGGTQWYVDVIECTGRIELTSVVGNKGIVFYKTDNVTKAGKFDQSALQPYDRVIVRFSDRDKWRPDFWGYRRPDDGLHCCTGGTIMQMVPYNEKTKHLIGSADGAPDFYKLW